MRWVVWYIENLSGKYFSSFTRNNKMDWLVHRKSIWKNIFLHSQGVLLALSPENKKFNKNDYN